ncbi:DNA ligase D [Pedobacter sp. HMF7647]|uniref:DNA ligase (ATP) n=1 Tax=Hufsiella arboris TaxID=2695275 RepID=A0A7K1YF09_9SPHI|nr:DNA ligase D [Hufsiella arboris]MXV53185.1 DNA ligase D [Hufsiella arboris]
MSLDKYVKKRDFSKTSEPKSGKSTDKEKLRFVIQKHDASHLHYDFRLEMEGVLKSWAVPKGPSTDPEVKRLAMMVEDHPYSYRTFEGIIPKGQYGGGTVIVWDEGTYEAADDDDDIPSDKKAQEKHLLHGLHSGKLKFKLSGKKVKGEFALVKAYGRGENSWLLMKLEDKYASTDDITRKDKSVLSGLNLEKVAKTSDKIWNSNRVDEQDPQDKLEESVETADEPSETNTGDLLKNAKKVPFPENVKPMLATLVDKPFDDPNWVYEVKWDGYRAIASVNKDEVELYSRNLKSFNEKFYPIYEVLKTWDVNVILDGEIMVLNEKGLSDFGALQNWRSEADGELAFYAFDIIWLEGKDLTGLPLSERQQILKEILPTNDDRIRLSQVFKASGTDFFNAAERTGLEGIIAKKADSLYSVGNRSKEWLKIKVSKRQEVIICGFTRNDGTSKLFSALLLGVFENGVLHYAGKVGTGFNDQGQKDTMKLFKPLIIQESPFNEVPDYNKPSRFRPNPPHANATWLKPELVCEVSFTETTSDGVFRHPSFKGMREDKKAKEVVREKEAHTADIVEDAENNKNEQIVKAPSNKKRKTLLNPKDETQVRKINGHDLKFTHLSKVYWPGEGITKRDMFNYYYQVAEYILPYLKDRPQSLNRFPNGINAKGFYQKDVKDSAPDWAQKFPYTTSDGEHKEYLVGTNEASLLWMASLGCIEMNPWFSRVQSPDCPDYSVIDLDPDKNTFDQVIEAALEVKKVLDAIDVPCYCKTSGSTGMHIYIPLKAKYSYDQSQLFAKLIVSIVHEQLPEFTSLERMISNRKGKMYLDFLQNRPGATIACPFSVRPKPGATVSMPLHWEEVKPGLTMKHFTIFNAVDRVNSEGDPFKGALGKAIDLEKAVKKAKSIFDV